MLTLTRRVGQRILVGDDIVIVVREVRGGHVKIGVEAPREWPVYRGELYDAIKAENRAAAQASENDLAAALQRLTGSRKPAEGQPADGGGQLPRPRNTKPPRDAGNGKGVAPKTDVSCSGPAEKQGPDASVGQAAI